MLWLAEGIELAADARKAIADGNLKVSPISGWEIANLVRKNRIVLAMPIIKWFRQTLDLMQAATPELTLEILRARANCRVHRRADPADRIIIATAREARMVLSDTR